MKRNYTFNRIKKLIQIGCRITYPYKIREDQWVEDFNIYLSAGYKSQPAIIVGVGGEKRWDLAHIDDAVQYFCDNAFAPANLMWMVEETLAELNENRIYLDMEIDEDRTKVFEIIKEKLQKIC